MGETGPVLEDGWEQVRVRSGGADGDDDVPVEVPDDLRHLAPGTDPVIGPGPSLEEEAGATLPRLARHTITLDDGHQVGVAVCGQGVPLVVVHGFLAEGILYAQTLSRLVDLGFRVIAVDAAGHGSTLGLPADAQTMQSYAELLGRVLDHLGVPRAVLVGHSMGGRLVTELAARQPHRAIAVVLLDAIVGDTWDRMVNVFRVVPGLLVGMGATLALDTITTVPLFRDPRQALKLGRLVAPTLAAHLRRPWRLLGPMTSILRSRGTRWMLERLQHERIPVFAIHGDWDLAVPIATARDAARRARGDLVVIEHGTHSWLLRDPETLPNVMHALMRGRLGTAVLKARLDVGLDTDATGDDIDAAMYRPGAPVLELTPRQRFVDVEDLHRPPRYRWRVLPAR